MPRAMRRFMRKASPPTSWAQDVSAQATALYAQLLALHGANLVGLYIGEDMQISGANEVISWPGRVGPTLLPTGAAKCTMSLSPSGRRGIYNGQVSATVRYGSTFPASASALAVLTPDTLPFPDFCCAVRSGSIEILLGYSGNSTWWFTGTFYRDGAATANVVSGEHIYENVVTAVSASGTVGGAVFGAARNWLGSIRAVRLLATAPTAPQRASELAILKSYYSIA